MARKSDKLMSPKDLGRCFKYFTKFAWQTNKTYYFWLILGFVVGIVYPFISILGTEQLVNEIAPGGPRRVSYSILWIAVICVGTWLGKVLAKAE